jgi:proline-specific peptidase
LYHNAAFHYFKYISLQIFHLFLLAVSLDYSLRLLSQFPSDTGKMNEKPTKEDTIPFTIPVQLLAGRSDIPDPCFTYYKVFGDLLCGAPRVVVLHGGPGSGHETNLTLAELWSRYRLPVVFYDQIGCAGSSHLPQTAGDMKFWNEPLFAAELDNLLDTLGLREGPGFHLFGHSWGGMFGAAFAASRPRGLRRLVLASALPSMDLSIETIRLRVAELPIETQKTLHEYTQKEEYEHPAYQSALMVFLKRYLCRDDPFPIELIPTMRHLSEDTTVYGTMYVSSVI